jgi:hypothetical protein
MRRYFLSSRLGSAPNCRWATVDDEGLVDGETPLEDFAPYVLTDHEITADEAVQLHSSHLNYLDSLS